MTADVTMNSERKKRRIGVIPRLDESFVAVFVQRHQGSLPFALPVEIGQNRLRNQPNRLRRAHSSPITKPSRSARIVKLTKGKPSTVKLRLKEIVEKGHLVPKGQDRTTFYLRSDSESAS